MTDCGTSDLKTDVWQGQRAQDHVSLLHLVSNGENSAPNGCHTYCPQCGRQSESPYWKVTTCISFPMHWSILQAVCTSTGSSCSPSMSLPKIKTRKKSAHKEGLAGMKITDGPAMTQHQLVKIIQNTISCLLNPPFSR